MSELDEIRARTNEDYARAAYDGDWPIVDDMYEDMRFLLDVIDAAKAYLEVPTSDKRDTLMRLLGMDVPKRESGDYTQARGILGVNDEQS